MLAVIMLGIVLLVLAYAAWHVREYVAAKYAVLAVLSTVGVHVELPQDEIERCVRRRLPKMTPFVFENVLAELAQDGLIETYEGLPGACAHERLPARHALTPAGHAALTQR